MTTGALVEGPYATLDAFDDWGIRALVTTRDAGTFSTSSDEPAAAVSRRWDDLRAHLFGDADAGRLATARQVHGARVVTSARMPQSSNASSVA